MGQLYRCETSTSQNSCYSIFQYAQQRSTPLGILLCHLRSVDSSNVSGYEKSIPMTCWFRTKKVKQEDHNPKPCQCQPWFLQAYG